MEFEWDARKAAANLTKHRVSLVEAATVFGDPLAITVADPSHSFTEQRELTFGCCSDGRLLVVAHTERGGRMRLISARLATPRERKAYEQGADGHA
ncbi:MAG: BrnT family toxin [Armatimonadetes bacterium]|nr:BrnT family toxin [Armatimonadota bacterium]